MDAVHRPACSPVSFRNRLLSACLLALAALVPLPANAQDPVLPEWVPEIDRVIVHLQSEVDTAATDASTGRMTADLLALNDTKLYMLFHRWADFLSGDERVQQMGEQRRWLARRADVMDSAAAARPCSQNSESAAGAAAIEMTKARIAEIETRLTERTRKWEMARRKVR